MEKQKVLIVGGASGLGKALAQVLARDAGVQIIGQDEVQTIEIKPMEPLQYKSEDFVRGFHRRGKGERKRDRANRYR